MTPPSLEGLPPRLTTRFAPAPTGYLHLGHLANAIYVWGVARATAGAVVLRIEDHDRQRCRPAYEAALLEDLDRMGLAADRPSTDELRSGPSAFRQSDADSVYEAALDGLDEHGLVYACDCTRSTFARWEAAAARTFAEAGCPGSCRQRGLERRAGLTIRVAIGGGEETWEDVALGSCGGPVAVRGDLAARDRHGNWTYAFCVVVDDIRHGIDLVIRGGDLATATPAQIRLARVLGRVTAPRFLHHPLIRKPGGAKLSKADNDTSIRSLLATGRGPDELLGDAALAVGLLAEWQPLSPMSLARLFE